jgi:dienelactone hydrolase
MRDAHVDWQLVTYGGAVHCFTDAHAGSDLSHGCAYNAEAEQRSWRAMLDFFREAL